MDVVDFVIEALPWLFIGGFVYISVMEYLRSRRRRQQLNEEFTRKYNEFAREVEKENR